jgi:hypothetical protein
MNVPEAQRKQMIQAYQHREAVEFLIQNVLTAVPLPDQIRQQSINSDMLVVRALKISQMIPRPRGGMPPTYDSMH